MLRRMDKEKKCMPYVPPNNYSHGCIKLILMAEKSSLTMILFFSLNQSYAVQKIWDNFADLYRQSFVFISMNQNKEFIQKLNKKTENFKLGKFVYYMIKLFHSTLFLIPTTSHILYKEIVQTISLNFLILIIQQISQMNKRKIDVNQIKKVIVRGKKYRNINVKYEVMLSYFKQKDVKEMKIFQINFPHLIQDILTQLLTAELVFKLEQQNKEPLKSISICEDVLRLQTFYLKGLSKQYPIQQICQCLYVENNQKTNMKTLSIHKNKLMIFFKKLRLIYTDFCYCVGEKYIVEAPELRNFYEAFKSQWSKRQEKGRLSEKDKLQKRLCRSLFFLGVLIENNIYEAIEVAQRKKRQETDDLGTKSEKKKNIKGITQNHQSSTYSFGSTDLMSNFSLRLKSQKSEQDDYMRDYYYKNPYSEYSQKSERIISKSKFGLFDKIELKNLKGKFLREPKKKEGEENESKYEINYLSNDVENILIEQAFKIRKFKDSCQRNQYYSPNPYYYVDTMGYYQECDYSYSQTVTQNPVYQFYDPSFSGNYQNNTFNFNNSNPTTNSFNVIYEEGDEVNRLGRSFDFYNLVETRKNSHRFTNKKNNK